jgi:hypothetical protein
MKYILLSPEMKKIAPKDAPLLFITHKRIEVAIHATYAECSYNTSS